MMANDWKIMIFLSCLSVIVSCGEVLEEDISNDEVLLLAPGDSATVHGDSISFWWERMAGAREYEFNLVSPSFSNPERVIADSITSSNLLTFSLAPGAYEWEVRALNGGYASDYSYRSFSVDTAGGTDPGENTDISQIVVVLRAPGADAVIAADSVSFWWEEVTGADRYEFRLVSPSFDNPERVITDSVTEDNLLEFVLRPGEYEWEVRALNDAFATTYAGRSFQINSSGSGTDISAETVEVLSPLDGTALYGSGATFWWSEVDEAENYKIRLVSPSFDATTKVWLDTLVSSTKFSLPLDPGNYEWRIRALNTASQTEWQVFSFVLDTEFAADISGEQVVLRAPADNVATGQNELTLWWHELEGADSYLLEVVSPSFSNEVFHIMSEELTEDKRTVTLDSGNYQWRVKAINAKYETPFSTRTLRVTNKL